MRGFVCKIAGRQWVRHEANVRDDWFGIASIVFSLAFWIYAHSPRGPHSIYSDVAFVGIMTCAVPAALIAAWRGSKLWLLSLLGPLSGWMLVLSAKVYVAAAHGQYALETLRSA
jgi:hypothetical protein